MKLSALDYLFVTINAIFMFLIVSSIVSALGEFSPPNTLVITALVTWVDCANTINSINKSKIIGELQNRVSELEKKIN